MKQRQVKSGCAQRWNRIAGMAITLITLTAGIRAEAWTLLFDSKAVVTQPAGAQLVLLPATNSPRVLQTSVIQSPALDEKHLFALGMIETGNNDGEVGAAGEVSRYQIHPAVWHAYSATANYRDTAAAVEVARQHWKWLAEYFHEKTGRQPSDFDMYVLWNTRFGYYAQKGFSRARLATVVQDRAQRFVNLVNRKV